MPSLITIVIVQVVIPIYLKSDYWLLITDYISRLLLTMASQLLVRWSKKRPRPLRWGEKFNFSHSLGGQIFFSLKFDHLAGGKLTLNIVWLCVKSSKYSNLVCRIKRPTGIRWAQSNWRFNCSKDFLKKLGLFLWNCPKKDFFKSCDMHAWSQAHVSLLSRQVYARMRTRLYVHVHAHHEPMH